MRKPLSHRVSAPSIPLIPLVPVLALALGAGLSVAAVVSVAIAAGAATTGARVGVPPEAAAAGQQVPDWFLQGIEDKTRASGVWIADNSAYREEDGGIEAYGIEWRKGIGGKSMVGRLFSLRGGEELATHWEFRSFWHPGEKVAKAYQFGVDGTVGWGDWTTPEAGVSIVEQTFASPDGKGFRVRHVTRAEGDRDIGQSFDWVDGAWQPRRTYTWVLQR